MLVGVVKAPAQLFDWDALGQVIALTVSPLDSLHIGVNAQEESSPWAIYFASAYVRDGGR